MVVGTNVNQAVPAGTAPHEGDGSLGSTVAPERSSLAVKGIEPMMVAFAKSSLVGGRIWVTLRTRLPLPADIDAAWK